MTVITIFDVWEVDTKGKRSRYMGVCLCVVFWELSQRDKMYEEVKKVKLYCGKVWPHFLIEILLMIEYGRRGRGNTRYFSYSVLWTYLLSTSSTLVFETCTPETYFLCLLDETIFFKVFLLFCRVLFEWWNKRNF